MTIANDLRLAVLKLDGFDFDDAVASAYAGGIASLRQADRNVVDLTFPAWLGCFGPRRLNCSEDRVIVLYGRIVRRRCPTVIIVRQLRLDQFSLMQ